MRITPPVSSCTLTGSTLLPDDCPSYRIDWYLTTRGGPIGSSASRTSVLLRYRNNVLHYSMPLPLLSLRSERLLDKLGTNHLGSL